MIWEIAFLVAWFFVAVGTIVFAIVAFFRNWLAGTLSICSGAVFLALSLLFTMEQVNQSAFQHATRGSILSFILINGLVPGAAVGCAVLLLSLAVFAGRTAKEAQQ